MKFGGTKPAPIVNQEPIKEEPKPIIEKEEPKKSCTKR